MIVCTFDDSFSEHSLTHKHTAGRQGETASPFVGPWHSTILINACVLRKQTVVKTICLQSAESPEITSNLKELPPPNTDTHKYNMDIQRYSLFLS